MNIDNLNRVSMRIEEITRRFAVDEKRMSVSRVPMGGKSFEALLNGASSCSCVPCPSGLEDAISRASEKHGVNNAVIKAVISAESGFKSSAVSRTGARGLMQLMPGTAAELGVDPLDPEQNIDGGTRYLKQMIDRFGGIESALAAYNAGPGAVVRYGGVPPYAETRRYVQKVMENIDKYSGSL